MIALVIGHWIFYTFRKEKDIFNDTKFFQECPYCTYIFFNYYEEGDLKMCPKCQSYITTINQKPGPMFKKIQKDKSGVVLVSVLAISIAMLIVAVSILNSNVNVTLSGQRQIDRIKAEQIVKGQFWKNYSSVLTSGVPTGPLNFTLTETHRNQSGAMSTFSKSFSTSVTDQGIAIPPGLNGTRQYDIVVSY